MGYVTQTEWEGHFARGDLPTAPAPQHPVSEAAGPDGHEPESAVREVRTAYGAHHLQRGTPVEDVDCLRWGYGEIGPGTEVLGTCPG